MSTWFAVHLEGKKIKLVNDMLPVEEVSEPNFIENFMEVAYRSDKGGIMWSNRMAKLLNDDILVYPMDNTAQGIFTIGDLKKFTN